ncbi:MAG: hypothetical protein QOI36_1470 [Pseudonocardiales bacterium]|nr:hypothetical protein [Pseudonocardiales bacterium]
MASGATRASQPTPRARSRSTCAPRAQPTPHGRGCMSPLSGNAPPAARTPIAAVVSAPRRHLTGQHPSGPRHHGPIGAACRRTPSRPADRPRGRSPRVRRRRSRSSSCWSDRHRCRHLRAVHQRPQLALLIRCHIHPPNQHQPPWGGPSVSAPGCSRRRTSPAPPRRRARPQPQRLQHVHSAVHAAGAALVVMHGLERPHLGGRLLEVRQVHHEIPSRTTCTYCSRRRGLPAASVSASSWIQRGWCHDARCRRAWRAAAASGRTRSHDLATRDAGCQSGGEGPRLRGVAPGSSSTSGTSATDQSPDRVHRDPRRTRRSPRLGCGPGSAAAGSPRRSIVPSGPETTNHSPQRVMSAAPGCRSGRSVDRPWPG